MASEVARTGSQSPKHRDEEHFVRPERLRAEIQVGIDAYDRGDFVELGSEAELLDFIAALGREARGVTDERA